MQPTIHPSTTFYFATRVAGLSLSAACALFLATAALGRAESAPTFDLRASKGEIIDASVAARPVDTPAAKVAADGAIEITGDPAILIPYRNADPLFQSGPLTWIIKAKFKDLDARPEGHNYGLFWRWNAFKNTRSVCLSVSETNAFLFLIVPDGMADSGRGVSLPLSVIPPDEWVTFVCRFVPDNLVSMEIYDPNNELLKKVELRKNVPAEFFAESDTPFTIGIPEGIGCSIAHVRVWNEFMPDEKIPALLGK